MNRFFTTKRMVLVLTLTIMSLLIAACAGDAGETGSAGAAGADGAAGPAGPIGPAGANGTAGARGAVGDNGPAGVAGLPGTPGPDGESTTAGVGLSVSSVAQGTAADVSVWLTGFGNAESITVTLKASDGTTTAQTVTATNGIATAMISPTLLAKGLYAVIAEGDAGSKASTPLNIK